MRVNRNEYQKEYKLKQMYCGLYLNPIIENNDKIYKIVKEEMSYSEVKQILEIDFKETPNGLKKALLGECNAI